MTAWRTEGGTAIDRGRPLRFSFDGQKVDGLAGDTIASALLASGIGVVGRSFKYHRPRGIWGAGVEEPNALVEVCGPLHQPNVRATTEAAQDGMALRSVNGGPTAARDRNAVIDRFARFIPAAFYYKTFLFPNWHLFEPRIRAMAGLGRIDPEAQGYAAADQVNESCDVLVIGAGPAGLSAALAAAGQGKSVILCDDQTEPGGSLLFRQAEIGGMPGADWVRQSVGRLRSMGARVLTGTTAFGRYDHGLIGLAERRPGALADRLWRVRPKATILAAGAIERGLPFANNDLPGVMSAEAALVYLVRYGVAVGRKIVVATNNGSAFETAAALARVGAEVTLVDLRNGGGAAPEGVRLIRGQRIVHATGRTGVRAVQLSGGETIAAGAVLVSGGQSPSVHLYCQAQGKPVWDDTILGFVPGREVPGLAVVGAAAGHFGLPEVLESGAAAAGGQATPPQRRASGIVAAWPEPKMKGRVWIDLQNDVTAKDVELAARENFVSVEHLKRYTTLGMATDQGKTSNVQGLVLMAAITGKTIEATGTTTYRPPFVPVPLASFAGLRGGKLMNPVRRLALEPEHRADGAYFREYGGWLRPAWYGRAPEAEAVRREARQAREGVALLDGSPLGKIEVIGPEAAAFLDFVYYNTMSTLKPGRCRYGFILAESGIVYDDGVLVRLEENRFVVSCSSSHVAGVYQLLEEWRQDRFDPRRVFIHDATAESATLTVTGPKSRALLEALGLGLNLDEAALPHMATGWGSFAGAPVRVTRISFTGDRSYELSISADRAGALWRALKEAGRAFDATLLGSEALMILRAEKGYLIIGKDTDGMTRPMDLGATAPLEKKKVEFIGRRSLLQAEAQRTGRNQFVGLEVVDGGGMLPPGAHAVTRSAGALRSAGYVTSSYDSPTLGRPVALGLIEDGLARMGEIIDLQHLGKPRRARIAPACAFDPEGVRLNA